MTVQSSIVRDLPNLDDVRAGIRHHHERWDGTGYLHGLSGEAIPLIARLLAVADAFSAMTTSRPYRKALPIGERVAATITASAERPSSRPSTSHPPPAVRTRASVPTDAQPPRNWRP